MHAFRGGSRYLRAGSLALVLFLLQARCGSGACPAPCVCHFTTEVHCTFRSLNMMPRGVHSDVKRINLGYNSLTILKEHELSGLKSLELLMLHSNTIQTIEDRAFIDLKALQVLKMSYNRVKELRKDTFQGLDNLFRLYMDHNIIEFIHPEAFYGLTSLQLINLEGNILQQLHPDTFITLRHNQIFKFSSIKTIYLSENALTTLPATVFTGCYQLENLFLSGNPWSCDCRMDWLAAWIKRNPGVLKCKRDRKLSVEQMCPMCDSPLTSRGNNIIYLSSQAYTCSKPWIHSSLKQRNITMEENSYTQVLPKDFIAPIGLMEMKIIDQYNNNASVSCVVQRPGGLENLNVTQGVIGENVTTVSATVSTSLVCNIDYDHIRQLWGILASYSDSPMRLEREFLVTMSPEMIYTYKQARTADPELNEMFTEIEAEIKANPAWLLQGTINLQLDLTTTTYSTLHVKYFSNIEINIESNKVRRDRFSWTMIKKDNQTKTEFSVLSGGVSELNCETFGDPKPSIEWILPDGIKVRAPYSSEDRRIVILDNGKLTLKAADSSDSGIYHCIATNYLDADVLSFRVTVLSPDVEEEEVNGVQHSQTVGGSLVLDCETNGTPQATVHWILPDHTVVDRSFGNRKIYPNGTLAIHPLTERDRGFYRCLAANHLGVDLLASLANVSNDVSKVVPLTSIDSSGDDELLSTENSQILYSEGLSSRVNQESRTITSDRPYPRLQPSLRHGVTNRRGGSRHTGWSRRVFDKAYRKVDPERLADYIKRSQNKKSGNDKDSHINKSDKSQANVALSVDDETGSGISGFEGKGSMPDQAISITENPENIYGSVMTTYNLLENDQNKVTEITEVLSNSIATTENMRTITTGSYSHTDAIPMVPSVTLSNYEFQNDDETTPFKTTQDYDIGPSSSKAYISERSTDTPLQPFTMKYTVTDTMDERELQFSGDMPETATDDLPRINSHQASVLDRPTQRVNPVVHTSMDPESHTTFTAITTTEREHDEITFHTTQKIKSPHLPPGSTIISHQQIKIIPPNKKQPGRRRNFFSRRRIIRPNKITDIQSLLDKLKRPSVEYEINATVPYKVELTTSCDNERGRMPTVKSNAEHLTSGFQVQTSSVGIMEKLITTTLNTPFITSSMISPKSTTFLSAGQLKSDSSTEDIRSTNVPEQKPSKGPMKEVLTTVASTTTKASKVIQGKIPWQRLFGSKQGQREILKRLRKPSKPSVTIKSKSTVTTTTTTAPSMVLTALPTAESIAAPMTAIPHVRQGIQGNLGKSTDNIPSLSKFTESQNSLKVISLFTTASPSSKYHKTTVMYTPDSTPMYASKVVTTTASHITPVPPSMTKKAYKEDTSEFSGSYSGGSGGFSGRSSRIRKPSFHRRRFRGRRPLKESTTQAPTTKSATFETTTFMQHTTSRLTKPFYITTTEVAKSTIYTSSDKIDSDNKEFRTKAKPTNFPKTHSILSELSPTASFSYTTNTVMPYITPQSKKKKTKARINSNKRIPPQRGGGRYQTQRPVKKNREHLEQLTTTDSPDTKKRPNTERTLIFDAVTVVTTEENNKLTSFPSSKGISNQIPNNYDHITVYDTISPTTKGFESSTNDIASKPIIVGGRAASFTVESNSDALIPCEASGNPEPAISWKRFSPDTGTTLTIKGKLGKFEVFRNGTLLIQNAIVKDRGQYVCLAENAYGSDKLTVMLSVVAYPSRILEAKVREIKVHSGEKVELKCKTEGRPVPVVVWILANRTQVRAQNNGHGRVNVTKGGTLVIQQVSIYDRGYYKCIASNPAGIDTATVRLQVVAAPPGILEEKRQLLRAVVGQSVWMPCTAQGDPQPTTHWVLMDGRVVMPLYSSSRVYTFPNGTLHLKNLDVSDSGKYECIATSSTGSERRVVTLSVEKTEIAPEIIETSGKSTELAYGSQLHLNCSATGIPKPKIIWRLPSKALVDQWHRMGSRIQVLENGTLIIDSVSDKDAGDYLCVARSNAGDDLQLMKVFVSMKPAKIEPKFIGKKQVPYGKELKVDCKASGAPVPEISWGLPDGTLVNNALQADGVIRSRSKRYILFGNGTLYLNRVGMDEEGDYTCYAENTLGKDEMHVQITVVSAAPRIRPSPLNYARVKPGGNVRFDCEAIGEPKPKILWMLPSSDMIAASNERYLIHVNGSIDIRNVKLSDAGEYVCIARNAAGDESKVYKLEIDGNPPIINGYYQNKTVVKDTAEKYSRKLIDCKAEGDPPPKITWIMPDNIFLTTPYYGSRVTVHYNGTLEIRNVRPTDTAEFICIARNDGGESVLVIHLEVTNQLIRPIFKNPFNERLITRLGKTTVLNCSADGNPPPDMIWTLPNGTQLIGRHNMGSHHHLGSDGTFVIHNPSKGDAGKYRCAAKNKMGYIEKLIILEVGQKPYILTRPRGIIRSVSGEPLFLHCLADGSPRPNILWTVPGGHVISRSQITGRYQLMDNGTLVIHQTNLHDRGNYMCRAKNNVGDALLTVPVIIVAYTPRITNGPPPNVRTTTGIPVQLSCIAVGIPKPEITWELPDRSVLSTAGKGRSAGSELLHPSGTLIIQKPTRADSGTYKCLATNHLGKDTRVTFLTVI
ncbi:immunoglobulin superfamily member 10 [Tachysurus vachellii]|uniref:immunoglobulin superfamily member 10 n=1 Tax=Tachysurus vachellii TaxID=175792 RepID=UPI00296B50D7|nr:immunoglobulin superfamily member 10 [Tachysurus vachellii]